MGTVYYVLFATVLYRVLTRLRDRRAPALGLTLGVLLLNELWNWAFLGLRSTLAGFVGILVFAVPLSALFLVLRGREPLSAGLVAAYGLWVLYDLAWAFALWRLNGA